MTEEPARWEVPGRDLLGQWRPSVVTVDEQGRVVVLPPPPGGLVVDPESEFERLIAVLNAARSVARADRERRRRAR